MRRVALPSAAAAGTDQHEGSHYVTLMVDSTSGGRRTLPCNDQVELPRVARQGWALSLLVALVARHLDTPTLVGRRPGDLWRPVGISRVVPVSDAWVLWALLVVAAVAAVRVLAGRHERESMWVAYLAGLVVVSASYSHLAMWSHPEVPTFLAGLPLLFTSRGWGLRTAQLLLGGFFANALYWKLRSSGLDWGTPEHMRRVLTLRYEIIGDSPALPARMMLDHPLLAGLLAKANLLNQAVPLLMVPFLRHRWARYVAAGAWTMELAGLRAVMGLSFWAMLPLGLLFLIPAGTLRAPSRPLAGVLAGIVALQLVVSTQAQDRELRLYPFTSVTMYDHVADEARWLRVEGAEQSVLRIHGSPAWCDAWDSVRLIASDQGHPVGPAQVETYDTRSGQLLRTDRLEDC